MSAIVTTASVPAASFPVARLRLTVRGRRVLAFLAALPAVIALSLAILSGGGAIASDTPSSAAASFDYVTVLPGETLWSIAEAVAPSADPRDVVDALVRVNALRSGDVEAGQLLALPLEYTTGR